MFVDLGGFLAEISLFDALSEHHNTVFTWCWQSQKGLRATIESRCCMMMLDVLL